METTPINTSLMGFLQAVAREEGFYAVGTRPNRNNNPGDIEYGKFAMAHGATSTDGRFAIFPDAGTGFKAMAALFLAPAYAGFTVAQALNKWAPPIENQTSQYIRNICIWTGCKDSDLVAPLIQASLNELGIVL